METSEKYASTRWLRNWRAERESAAVYSAFSQLEKEPRQRALYEELANAERQHAAFWARRLRDAGYTTPRFRLAARAAMLIYLARHFGIGFVIPSIVSREMKDRDDYAAQADAREAGLARDEHGHAAILRRSDSGAFGNNLRAAVLGANDGLASNFCLMMGVAGGGVSASTIVLIGIVGLVAGACSMALGEWLSVTNARELALSQLDRAMGTHRPDEDHPSVTSAGDAVSAAIFSFVLVGLGALVPLVPFAFLPAALRITGSITLSMSALFVLGFATSLFNGRSPVFSGLRQTMIGTGAAAVTYLVGSAIGVLSGTA